VLPRSQNGHPQHLTLRRLPDISQPEQLVWPNRDYKSPQQLRDEAQRVTETIERNAPVVRTEIARQDASRAVARSSDPSTSWDAARQLGDLRESQKEVFALFDQPMTDEEIEIKAASLEVRQQPSGLRTRRRELVDLGLLHDTGGRRQNKNGNRVIVWGKD